MVSEIESIAPNAVSSSVAMVGVDVKKLDEQFGVKLSGFIDSFEDLVAAGSAMKESRGYVSLGFDSFQEWVIAHCEGADFRGMDKDKLIGLLYNEFDLSIRQVSRVLEIPKSTVYDQVKNMITINNADTSFIATSTAQQTKKDQQERFVKSLTTGARAPLPHLQRLVPKVLEAAPVADDRMLRVLKTQVDQSLYLLMSLYQQLDSDEDTNQLVGQLMSKINHKP